MPKRSPPAPAVNGTAPPPGAPVTHPALAHGRKVEYPTLSLVKFIGDQALRATGRGKTHKGARFLLGWTVRTEGAGDLRDTWGRPVVLENNAHNRPPRPRKFSKLIQDIGHRRYALNGENLVIGKTGLTLSCRHRLVALCLLHEEWAGPEAADPPLTATHLATITEEQRARTAYWRSIWGDTEPFIETTAALGVEETPEVIRTLDDTEARTATDVMATDPALYGTAPEAGKGAVRPKLLKTLAMAMGFVRQRAGLDTEEVSPCRAELTNSEVVEFLRAHPWLEEAVRAVMDLDAGGARLARYTGLGTAAGLLYLMATADSDGGRYRAGRPPREELLDFGLRGRALAFWEELAAGGGAHLAAVVGLTRPTAPGLLGGTLFVRSPGSGTAGERLTVLVRAWALYARGEPVPAAALLDAADYQPHRPEDWDAEGNVVCRDFAALPPAVTGTRLNARGEPLPGIDWVPEARDRVEEPAAEDPAFQYAAERRTAAEGPTGGLRVAGDDPAAERAARAELARRARHADAHGRLAL